MKCTEDCPRPSGGPSAVQLGRPTKTTNVSGEFLYWLADSPQYTYANPPETTTSLDKFLILPADRLALLGGPSAVHLRETTRNTMFLDKL